MIPPTYCITCPEIPDRQTKAKEYFDSLGLTVTIFNGVHGNTFGLRTVIPYEVDHPGSRFTIGAGVAGLILSHWCLWNVLWHQPASSGDEFMILEDDAFFVPNFQEEFASAYSQLPSDWQFVYVGHVGVISNPKPLPQPKVWQVPWCFGTHAYMVKRPALKVLLETNRILWAPTDIQIGMRSLQHLRTYAFYPTLVRQHSAEGKWPTTLG